MASESSEMAAPSSDTTLTANITVGQVTGEAARITGIEIQTLNLGTVPGPEAPPEAAVRGYLEKIKGLDQGPDTASDAADSQADRQTPATDETQRAWRELQALWGVNFYVHPYGQVGGKSTEMGLAIQALLYNRDRPATTVVILEEPGTGKTAALKRLRSGTAAATLARLGELPQATSTPAGPRLGGLVVPIYVELRNLAGDVLSLITSAYNQYAPAPIEAAETEKLLLDYNCLLLLDGLDETQMALPAGGIQLIRQFINGHAFTRCVFSSRIGSYAGQLGRAVVLELDLLTAQDVKTVLGDQGYDELSPMLQDLARYRQILEDIIRSHEPGQTALGSKGQLIQHVMRKRYKLSDAESSSAEQANRLTERLLEWLAFQMQRERAAAYRERQLKDLIGSYLQDWREGLSWRQGLESVESSEAFQCDASRMRWTFRDRSTQTYFVAAAMARHPDLLAKTLEEASDPLWAEAFEILVGIVDDPSRLLFDLVDRDARVAARCFGLARPPIQATFQDALLDALIEALGREPAEGREDIARFLNRNPLANVDHTERVLLDALQREWRSGSIRALTQALLPLVPPAPPEDGLTRKRLRAEDERDRLRTVVQLWRAYINGDPAAGSGAEAEAAQQRWRNSVENCLTEVMNDRNQVELVRGVAAIVLGAIGSASAWASLLTKWRKESMTEILGWCVTEGLAHLDQSAQISEVTQAALKSARPRRRKPARPSKPDSPPPAGPAAAGVEAGAQQAEDISGERRRVWAFYLLGYLALKEEATGLLYKALESPAESYRVRGYAAQAIGRLQPREARQKLLEALRTEEDLRVMRKIVAALGQVGTPDTIPILEDYLRTGRVQARTTVQRSLFEIRRRYGVSR